MGDMSKCSHGEYVGYCDTCSPDWELQLITAEAQDKIYQRGFEKGAADFKRRVKKALVNANESSLLKTDENWAAFDKFTSESIKAIDSLPLIEGEKE